MNKDWKHALDEHYLAWIAEAQAASSQDNSLCLKNDLYRILERNQTNTKRMQFRTQRRKQRTALQPHL